MEDEYPGKKYVDAILSGDDRLELIKSIHVSDNPQFTDQKIYRFPDRAEVEHVFSDIIHPPYPTNISSGVIESRFRLLVPPDPNPEDLQSGSVLYES